ncbi:hypothetical protein D3C77_393100 [compost metagenome]
MQFPVSQLNQALARYVRHLYRNRPQTFQGKLQRVKPERIAVDAQAAAHNPGHYEHNRINLLLTLDQQRFAHIA